MANWTKEQQSVIDARGHNLLVSAAAGSGKTAVLVERILGRITDAKHPVDIDRLLVVTFTRAAAAQMRERLGEALERKRLAEQELHEAGNKETSEEKRDGKRLAEQAAHAAGSREEAEEERGGKRLAEQDAHAAGSREGADEERDGKRLVEQGSYGRMERLLERQQTLLHNAQITTIDSFCLYVVRNHFEEISLDPGFRIADAGELTLLEQDVLDQVFEKWYAGNAEEASVQNDLPMERMESTGDESGRTAEEASGDESGRTAEEASGENAGHNAKTTSYEKFLAFVDAYSGSRDDSAVREMVLQLYHESASSPWPRQWIRGLLEIYGASDEEKLLSSAVIREVAGQAETALREAKETLEMLLEQAQSVPGLEKYAGSLGKDLEQFAGLEDCRDYRRLGTFLGSFKMGNIAQIRGFDGDEVKKEAIKNRRGAVKKEIESLKKSLFSMELSGLLEQLGRLRPMAEVLAALCLDFMDAIDREKRSRRIVDFSDIEHFALQILVDEETKELRPAAEEFAATFEEIMIDEYQDSNLVQESILQAISGASAGHRRLFMVGDVKQSIYRFRQACPQLFMEKYSSYGTTEDAPNLRIDLHRNFRSRREVLDFTNDMFYKLMQPDLGDVAYDEASALYCGADYPESGEMAAELLLYDSAETGETESRADEVNRPEQMEMSVARTPGKGKRASSAELVPRRAEARMTAIRIRELVDQGLLIKGEQELRPVRYGDIVILLRSLRGWGEDFADVLEEAGIPVKVENSTGYFSAREVQTVLCFLQILDNPYQDIPMAAVLRSPIVGLSEEDLAEIRVNNRGCSFAEAAYEAMKEAADRASSVPEEVCNSGQGVSVRSHEPEAANAAEKKVSARNHEQEAANAAGKGVSTRSHEQEVANAAEKKVSAGNHEPEAAFVGEELVTAGMPGLDDSCRTTQQAEDEPLARFYHIYRSLRDDSVDTPIHELIQKLLRETGYGNYVAAMPAGKRRAANLDMLVEKAIAYEKTSCKGLFQFVRYIEELRKYDVDYGEADVSGEEDAVRIMTIHKSKGLEFPVVFLCGVSRRFNQADISRKLVLHPDLGMGLREISNAGGDGMPAALRIRRECLLRSVIADRIRRENLGEELRVLYVAMTRAKEKLILTGCVKDYSRTLQKFTGQTKDGIPVSFTQRSQASSYLDWLLAAFLSYPGRYEPRIFTPEMLVATEMRSQAKRTLERDEVLERIRKARDRREEIDRLLSYEYPYKSEAGRKSKYSVSELKFGSMLEHLDETLEHEELLPELGIGEQRPEPQSRELLPEPGIAESGSGVEKPGSGSGLTSSGVEKPGSGSGLKGAGVEKSWSGSGLTSTGVEKPGSRTVAPCARVEKPGSGSESGADSPEPYIPLFIRMAGKKESDVEGTDVFAASGPESGPASSDVLAVEGPESVPESIDVRVAAGQEPGLRDRIVLADGESSSGTKKIYTYLNVRGGAGTSQAALRGTAVHRVMECLDFAAIAGIDPNDRGEVSRFVREELRRMRRMEEITDEMLKLVFPSMIENYVKDPVAQRMALAQQRGELFREKPFVMDYQGVLVQGIIDVFWMEEGRIVLLDYKTDRVETALELAGRYRKQLELYADALNRYFGEHKPVEKLLYSFSMKQVVEV